MDINSSAVASKLPLIMNVTFQVMAFVTYHLALHCFADFLCNKEAMRDHWFLPYFITAAFRISSLKQKQFILSWIVSTHKAARLSWSSQHSGFHAVGWASANSIAAAFPHFTLQMNEDLHSKGRRNQYTGWKRQEMITGAYFTGLTEFQND